MALFDKTGKIIAKIVLENDENTQKFLYLKNR